MNRYSTEAKVGIFFLAAIAIFSYVWFRVLDIGVQDGFTLKARFRSVEGLVKDAQVQIAGIRIGTVRDVEYDSETGKAAVTMSINEAYRNSIPEGSRLFIKSKGLTGDKYLVIEPGKPNARKLKPGEEISLVFEPTDPDKVLESVGIIAQNLQMVTKEVRNQIIEEKGAEKFDRVLDNSDAVFKDLRELLTRNKTKINQTIDNTETAVKSVGHAGDRFGKAASDLEILTRDIRSGKGTLGKLVNDESLYKEAQGLVSELRGISGSIQSGSGTMGRLINDPEMYYEARRAIRNMNKTAEDVSEATPISTLAIILGSVLR